MKTKGAKLRYPTWYWGKYIEWTGAHWIDERGVRFPSKHVCDEFETYSEETHGIHNSKEYKDGQKQVADHSH